MDASFYILLFATGVLGGFLAGLLGIGGGLVYVLVIGDMLPSIGVVPNEMAQYTIANSLFAIFFASLSACLSLIKSKEFYIKETLLIGSSSIVIAILIQQIIVNNSLYSFEDFNIFLIVILLYMLIKTFLRIKTQDSRDIKKLKGRHMIIAGSSGGTIASLSGLGGGVIMMPILNTIYKLDYKVAKSLSLGVICITSFVYTLFNFFEPTTSIISLPSQGVLIFPIVLILSLGVSIASPLGVIVARKISSKTATSIYAIFLLIFLVKKMLEVISSY